MPLCPESMSAFAGVAEYVRRFVRTKPSTYQSKSSLHILLFLSGSNAAKQVLSDNTADIDFCEYVIVPDTSLLLRIASLKTSRTDLACTAMRIGPAAWQVPWSFGNDDLRDAVKSLCPKQEDYATLKFDYLACPPGSRATEMSNLIILCDSKGKSKGFSKTFAAQEAPLGATNWVPNQFDRLLRSEGMRPG